MGDITIVKGYGDLAKLKRVAGREAVVRSTSCRYKVVDAHWVRVGRALEGGKLRKG